MTKDITANADKFDAVLRRMLAMKPKTVKELSAKLKKDKAKAKKKVRPENGQPPVTGKTEPPAKD